VKKLPLLCLCLVLLQPAHGYRGYGDENPFVEAMLRMMEVFGLIDRSRLPLAIPQLPGSGLPAMSGFGNPYGIAGMSGMGMYPGTAMLPGMSPLGGMGPGLGGMPGVNPLTGMAGWPGGFPQSGGWPYPPAGTWQAPSSTTGKALLDGVWELNKGGFVIIRGRSARLYLSRDKTQDFTIGYDHEHFWWSPRGSKGGSRYRYQMKSGRMILRDSDGNMLLLKRRR